MSANGATRDGDKGRVKSQPNRPRPAVQSGLIHPNTPMCNSSHCSHREGPSGPSRTAWRFSSSDRGWSLASRTHWNPASATQRRGRIERRSAADSWQRNGEFPCNVKRKCCIAGIQALGCGEVPAVLFSLLGWTLRTTGIKKDRLLHGSPRGPRGFPPGGWRTLLAFVL